MLEPDYFYSFRGVDISTLLHNSSVITSRERVRTIDFSLDIPHQGERTISW
jgi:hypothetical protein